MIKIKYIIISLLVLIASIQSLYSMEYIPQTTHGKKTGTLVSLALEKLPLNSLIELERLKQLLLLKKKLNILML